MEERIFSLIDHMDITDTVLTTNGDSPYKIWWVVIQLCYLTILCTHIVSLICSNKIYKSNILKMEIEDLYQMTLLYLFIFLTVPPVFHPNVTV